MTVANFQVVQNLDIQKLSSFDQGARDGDIIMAWVGVSRGAVVSANDRRGSLNDGMAENFRQSDTRLIHSAGIEFHKLLDAVAGVQDHNPEFFAWGVGHEGEKILVSVAIFDGWLQANNVSSFNRRALKPSLGSYGIPYGYNQLYI